MSNKYSLDELQRKRAQLQTDLTGVTSSNARSLIRLDITEIDLWIAATSALVEKTDMVNHPTHYKAHPSGVECITITEHFNFNLGNVIKYVWRSGEKGAYIEQLEKAEFYLKREIARVKDGDYE